MNRLIEHLEGTIVNRGLLPDGQSSLVAVSGGVDSMVLLAVLNSLAARHNWKLAVAHFNHRLRGAESDADEQLVRDAAKRLSLPLVVENWVGESRESSIKSHGLEMAARLARHAFWDRAAKSLRMGTLATAHHADDQVELFFIRLFRGSGTDGLGGMEWSAVGVLKNARIIRPLLDQSKEALEEYAQVQKISFREDSSNRNTELARNRIRRELLPRLAAEYEPAILKTILRSMEIIAAESDFVRAAAKQWLTKNNRVEFARLHPAVQRQCLRLQLMELMVAADFKLVEHLRLNPDQPATAAQNSIITRDREGRVHRCANSQFEFNPGETAIKLERKCQTAVFNGLSLTFERMPLARAGRITRARPGREHFDASKVGAKINLRHWRKGDRFQPIGMMQPVKLQDLFSNLKIPRRRRQNVVLAVSEAGDIFWVEGLRISEAFKITAETGDVLRWKWSRK